MFTRSFLRTPNGFPRTNQVGTTFFQNTFPRSTTTKQRRFVSTMRHGKRFNTQSYPTQPNCTGTSPLQTITPFHLPSSQYSTSTPTHITRNKPSQHSSIHTTSRRKISFNPGSGFGKNKNQPPSSDPTTDPVQDDLRRFAFKKPQQYNLSQNTNTAGQNAFPHQTTLTGHRLPNPGSQTTTILTVKEQFMADPSIPRWRKDWVRIQDFLSDSARPLTLESDPTLTRLGKRLVRVALAPSRRLWKFSRWFWIKITGMNRFTLLFLLALGCGTTTTLFWVNNAIDRVNMRISRELFVRSCVIDLAARLDAYGLLSYDQTNPILSTFHMFSSDSDQESEIHSWYSKKKAAKYAKDDPNQFQESEALALSVAPKNFRGQEMMKSFLIQAMSLPVESSRTLEALYDPHSRIDPISESIHLVMLERLADSDPSQANERCPPHIKAIAARTVEEWFKRSRLQMIEEKKVKIAKELREEGLDDLTQEGRNKMKEKLSEFNIGITFDLSKREKRKLFWKGILTGIMLETGLVGLENETTFLRLAREYALKGCVLRKIPDQVKISDLDLGKIELADFTTTADQALVMANPAGEFKFSSSDELVKIRDSLTQQPYSPDHGQIDNRFLNFVFGREFCQEYGLTPDSFPYLHQIAPLAILDLANWTHPHTLLDLTHQTTPSKLQGSKYTVAPAEYEKIEMYNFMMDELIKKDKAYSYLEKEYRQSSISKDELIVLPLIQPQDSIRNPARYGLREIDSQIKLLDGRIPQCYQDTYGAYAKQIFLFDMVILRNFLEISRLKRSLGELGTGRIRDMTIPSSSNYYGNYDQLLETDLLDVIKQEENLTTSYRLRGTDFRKEFDQRARTDAAQLNVRDPLNKLKSREQTELEQIDTDFRSRRDVLRDQDGQKVKPDPHSVTVDASLLKELNLKQGELSDLERTKALQQHQQQRQTRAQKWIDNGSV